MTAPDAAALPCPWCGATDVEIRDGDTFRWRVIQCANCGASPGEVRIQTLGEGTREQWEQEARKDAYDLWNRRTPPADRANGWKLVPVELTKEMSDRIELSSEFRIKRLEAEDLWWTFLQAAPPAPEMAADRAVLVRCIHGMNMSEECNVCEATRPNTRIIPAPPPPGAV